MHSLHIIASVGETKEDAYFAAEQGLAPYGEGRVWDWHEMGGRWEDHIGASCSIEGEPIPGVTQLCYSENPELFDKTINDEIAIRNSDILETFQCIRGDAVSVEEVPVQYEGIPVQDREETARRVSTQNAAHKENWDALLACQTSAELDALLAAGPYCMTTYRLYRALTLLTDQYCFNSRFYDMDDYTGQRWAVDNRKGINPDQQWITVFDLHN